MVSQKFYTELRRAVDTGEVKFGYKIAEKSMLLGRGKLLVIAKNIPEEKKEKLVHLARLSNIKVIFLDKNSREIGKLCGKPFSATALVIYSPGDSKVLEVE